jgi:ribosomal protein L19
MTMNNLPKNEKGLIMVGGPISRTKAQIRIHGDDLDPNEITALLCCEPTKSHCKGDVKIGSSTGKEYVKKSGMWSLDAAETAQQDLDKKILDLLDQLTDDVQVWRNINSRFSVEAFCGLFMERSNEGLSISASTLVRMADRGIELQLDIYGPEFDEDMEGHFEVAKLKGSRPLN